MGYYSNVALAIRKTDYQRMLKELEESNFNLSVKKQVAHFLERGTMEVPTCKSDEDYMYMTWLDEKWYDEFEEVAFVKKFLESVKDYDLIIIGEDIDDITEIGKSGQWLVKPCRTFEFS